MIAPRPLGLARRSLLSVLSASQPRTNCPNVPATSVRGHPQKPSRLLGWRRHDAPARGEAMASSGFVAVVARGTAYPATSLSPLKRSKGAPVVVFHELIGFVLGETILTGPVLESLLNVRVLQVVVQELRSQIKTIKTGVRERRIRQGTCPSWSDTQARLGRQREYWPKRLWGCYLAKGGRFEPSPVTGRATKASSINCRQSECTSCIMTSPNHWKSRVDVGRCSLHTRQPP